MIQGRQIEAFRAVMLTGSMTTAAETIHVTQPAVSRLVRDLESELDLALFFRRGNLVVPTSEAHALLAEVERAFIGLGQIRAFADDLRTGRGGSLRLAVLPAMAAGFVPRFVADFCRRRPNLKVSIYSPPSSVIRDRVAAGQFDIGVADLRFQRGSLTVTKLDDDAVVAMPAGHRLTGLRVVRAEDLHDEHLITVGQVTDSHHPIQVALQAVRCRQVIDTTHSAIACVLVSEGMGVAIVDPFSASEFVGKGLVVRPFEPSWIIGSALVHSNERALSVIAEEFRDAFLDHVRRYLAQAEYLNP